MGDTGRIGYLVTVHGWNGSFILWRGTTAGVSLFFPSHTPHPSPKRAFRLPAFSGPEKAAFFPFLKGKDFPSVCRGGGSWLGAGPKPNRAGHLPICR